MVDETVYGAEPETKSSSGGVAVRQGPLRIRNARTTILAHNLQRPRGPRPGRLDNDYAATGVLYQICAQFRNDQTDFVDRGPIESEVMCQRLGLVTRDQDIRSRGDLGHHASVTQRRHFRTRTVVP